MILTYEQFTDQAKRNAALASELIDYARRKRSSDVELKEEPFDFSIRMDGIEYLYVCLYDITKPSRSFLQNLILKSFSKIDSENQKIIFVITADDLSFYENCLIDIFVKNSSLKGKVAVTNVSGFRYQSPKQILQND